MEIGTLRPHHRARLAELLEATDAFHEDEIEVALSLFDQMATLAAGAADYEFVGAFDDGRLIGYACFGPTPATEGTYDLYWLAVHPAAQGAGVGRALVHDVRTKLSVRVVVCCSLRPPRARATRGRASSTRTPASPKQPACTTSTLRPTTVSC